MSTTHPSRREFTAAAAMSAIGVAAGDFSLGGRVLRGAEIELVIRADEPGATISRHIYGHFAEHLGRCIYEGIWVGDDSPIPNTRGIRNDVVAALRGLGIPNLRWPGGCFADEYHWRDGIGPRDKRPARINTHWGGVIESNHFGTHEFFDLCEQLECEPYVCGNVGSGTVQEMMEWVEYMTSDADSALANLRRANGREAPWKLPYFGVGNESWGCGGSMTAEYYADEFRRYNTFVKNYSGNRVYRIACGANGGDYHWTETLMRHVGGRMNGLSLHHYTVPTGEWGRKGSATDFDVPLYHATLARALHIEELVQRHAAIMDQHDREKRIGMIVDEWGVWNDVEPGTNPGFLYQQNSLRDALVAAMHLHVFHRFADRVAMANIAQTVNVLQAMILTEGQRMLLTPTYHVFEMFRPHHEGRVLPVEMAPPAYEMDGRSIPQLGASASAGAEGRICLSLCNFHHEQPAAVRCVLRGAKAAEVTGRVLTAPEVAAHNTFDAPDRVRPAPFEAARPAGEALSLELPPRSVVVLEMRP